MDKERFQAKLTSLLKMSGEIQIRLSELKEFERQWSEIFAPLISEFGVDVKIRIANQMLLHTFRHDKYHVICDDLLSLIENEMRNEFSVCRNGSEHLAVRPISAYIADEDSIRYTKTTIDARSRADVVDTSEVPLFIKESIAQERRRNHVNDFNFLFGDGQTESHFEHLKSKLKILADEIKGLRQLFSHRHEIVIQKRYVEKWRDLEFSNLEVWFHKFFEIVQKMVLLAQFTHHRGVISTWNKSVNDQLDLILFGDIENCIHLFFQNKDIESYSAARTEFYKSRQFVDILVVR